MNKIIKRELEVAFSRQSQPIWFKVVKYFLLGAVIYLFWGSWWLGPMIGALIALALVLHFWVRYKTKGWTQSYGLWDYNKNKPGG